MHTNQPLAPVAARDLIEVALQERGSCRRRVRQQHRQQQARTAATAPVGGSASRSVNEAVADAGEHYGGPCKTAYIDRLARGVLELKERTCKLSLVRIL